jgi:alpha-N-arabinofuranosidase
MIKTARLLTTLALVTAALPFAQAAELSAKAVLKADQPGSVIPRHLYGQFSEHLGSGIYDGVWVGPDSKIPNVRGIRSDVVAALKEIKVPVIRWPGGCFADEYRWRDGIGDRSKRPSRKNNWWGGSPEPNQFGTHEFMDFAEQVGADAYVSINVGSSDPTEMREWIEYMTSPGDDTLAQERRKNGRSEPFNVPFIGIGNESWGCGGEMTAEYYANEYRRFSAFFHKNNDNPAVRVASGANEFDTHWTDVVTKHAGKRMDAISVHYYTIQTGDWKKKGAAVGFDKKAWARSFSQTLKMDELLRQHIAVMDKNDPDQRIALYVDEWGTWYDVEPGTNPGHLYQLNTLRDGIVAAANFNIFHRYTDRVRMTNIAQTINVLQAMILTRADQLALTPTYFAYKMYVPFQDATALPFDVSAPPVTIDGVTIPAFNASAARGKDGKIYLGFASMSPDDAVKLQVDLSGLKAKKVTGQMMTGNKLDAYNDFGSPAAVAPAVFNKFKVSAGELTVNLPARSVVVLAIE